ncbi:hypothetical protein BS78_02G054900 [Paspalum vaginatum]|nr:hypothetical protein BS78_02G054900 [Paspalum vaginatum]
MDFAIWLPRTVQLLKCHIEGDRPTESRRRRRSWRCCCSGCTTRWPRWAWCHSCASRSRARPRTTRRLRPHCCRSHRRRPTTPRAPAGAGGRRNAGQRAGSSPGSCSSGGLPSAARRRARPRLGPPPPGPRPLAPTHPRPCRPYSSCTRHWRGGPRWRRPPWARTLGWRRGRQGRRVAMLLDGAGLLRERRRKGVRHLGGHQERAGHRRRRRDTATQVEERIRER